MTGSSELRWRRDGKGGLIARPDHAGATYHITVSESWGRPRPGKLYRLYVDGVEQTDAAGCTLRHIKHRANTLAFPPEVGVKS